MHKLFELIKNINKNKGKITTTTAQASVPATSPVPATALAPVQAPAPGQETGTVAGPITVQVAGPVAGTTKIPENYDLKYKLTLIPKKGSIRSDREWPETVDPYISL